MANDRMSLKCRCCGKKVMIAKDLGGWHTQLSFMEGKIEEIDNFLENHGQCCENWERVDFEAPFELEYENTGGEKERMIYRLKAALDETKEEEKKADILHCIKTLESLDI